MKKERVRKFLIDNPVFVFFFIYFIVAVLFVPNFGTSMNIRNIFIHSSDMIIISIGMVIVVMNGGIDFSVTSNISLGSVVGALIMSRQVGVMAESQFGWIVAIFAMLTIGAIIGIINGFSVVVLKMPSFIVTMVGQLVFGGLALWITMSATIIGLPEQFIFIGEGSVLGIPFPVILAMIVLIVAYYVLHKTVFGRYLFAIGTSHKTSRISGVPVKKTIFTTFIICGVLGALGGIVMTARIGAGMPGLGRPIFLDVVAAIVIGGTSIMGGKGNVPGAAMGAIFIVVLNNSLSHLGIPWYVQNICKGMLVLAASMIDVYSKNDKLFTFTKQLFRRNPASR